MKRKNFLKSSTFSNPARDTTDLILTEEEKRLVLNHRKQVKEAIRLNEKRKACSHVWRFAGSSRVADAYDCTVCGATKWE